MGHDSFQLTNAEEPTTEINPKSIGKDTPADVVDVEELSHTKHVILTSTQGDEVFEVNGDVVSALENALSTLSSRDPPHDEQAEILLPFGRFDIDSTYQLNATRNNLKALRIGARTGLGEKNGGDAGMVLNSQITDGSPVFDATSGSNSLQLRNIMVKGNGSEGTAITTQQTTDLSKFEGLGAITVGGDGLILGGQEITISRCMSQSAGGNGMLITAGGSKISNLESEDAGKSAIRVECSNSIIDAPLEAETATNHGFEFWEATQVTVQNSNRITNNGKYGVRIYKSDQIILDNLAIFGNSSGGVGIGSGTNPATHIVVQNCELSEDNGPHIDLKESAHRITICNNEFKGSGSKISANAAATDIFADIPAFNGEQSVSPSSSTYTLSFDTAFTHYPRINLTADAAVNSYSNWTTDANGNYVSVDVSFGTTPSNVSWEAIPRNVGV